MTCSHPQFPSNLNVIPTSFPSTSCHPQGTSLLPPAHFPLWETYNGLYNLAFKTHSFIHSANTELFYLRSRARGGQRGKGSGSCPQAIHDMVEIIERKTNHSKCLHCACNVPDTVVSILMASFTLHNTLWGWYYPTFQIRKLRHREVK